MGTAICCVCGHIAQRLEHVAYNDGVAGSNPAMPTEVAN